MPSTKRLTKKMRDDVFRRDHGVCAECGIDCVDLKHRMNMLKRANFEGWKEAKRLLVKYGFDMAGNYWEADHIVPLAEGGANELKNIQLLCRGCHKAKTAEQAARRGKQRRLVGRKHRDMKRFWRELGLEMG